jgi:signal transduction histidine kinase
MELRSKQSGGSGIASEHKVFFWARLKLTAIYVLIVGLILLGFSLILYQSLDRNLVDASEDNFTDVETHHHFVQNTLSTVVNEILVIDFIILVVTAGVSYVLAGYTLRPIQLSVEAQKKFSENASHELRTPIAVMKNEAEVLLRNPHPSKELIHATLKSNIEEMDRMSKMVEDLLVLARSKNGNEASFVEMNLRDVAQHMVNKLQPLAARKGVTLETADDGPLSIHGNTAGIERVLMNLLQNAIEHTPKDGSVKIRLAHGDAKAIITISDTGSGIDEKDLPHIFERFYKGNGTSGSGLGLSIVKEIVDQHQGKVELDSVKGLGTTVSVTLPLIT